MTRRILLAILIALALVGLADSWYLSSSAIAGDPLVCDIGGGLDGCNVVAQSPYSKVYGIALADLGIVFYGALLVLSAALLVYSRRFLYRALVGLSALGVLFSLVFLYVQFFLIQALCIYCLVSAAISFAVLPLSLYANKRHALGLPAVVP